MTPKQNHFTVTSNKELADGIYLISLKPEEKFDYQAGQYVSFKIVDKVNRSYSIASSPSDESIDFLVEWIEGGVGSTYFKNLKPGDEIEGVGPLGFFTLEKSGVLSDENPIIFVATGSGITPVRSMIRYLLHDVKHQRKIYLYFGLRYDDKSYLFDEFKELDEKYQNFEFTPVISKPSENWSGVVGHCQDCLLSQPIIQNAHIFLCGSNANIDSMMADLMAYGYPKERMFFEKYG